MVELPEALQGEISRAIAEMHAAQARVQAAQARVQALWNLAAEMCGEAGASYEPVVAVGLRVKEPAATQGRRGAETQGIDPEG